MSLVQALPGAFDEGVIGSRPFCFREWLAVAWGPLKARKQNEKTRFKQLLALGLIVLGLNLIPQSASAFTTNGVMSANETWSGNIELTGDVTVPNNVTLTILPGTRVACWDKYDGQAGGLHTTRIELIINSGILSAVGTSNNPILFTSSPLYPPALAGDWYGIRLKAATNGVSTLRYCTVEFATEGLRVEGGQPTIDHCSFRTNSVDGLFLGVYGIIADCSLVGNQDGIVAGAGCKMSRCFVNNNQAHGVYVSAGGVLIEDSQVTGNSPGAHIIVSTSVRVANTLVANNRWYGIGCDYGTELSVTKCVITNNLREAILAGVPVTVSDSLIDGNGSPSQVHGWELRMTNTIVRNSRGFESGGHNPGLGLECRSTFLKDCSIYNNDGGGMDLNGGPNTVVNCLIQDNGLYGIGGWADADYTIWDSRILNNVGVGLNLHGVTSVSTIALKGNLIQGNQVGLQLSGSGANITGISSNNISGNASYELRNSGSAAIIASNNFWGQPTTTELANNVRKRTKIYDSQWDSNVGGVLLTPWLTNDPFALPPQITGQPADLTVAAGDTASFNVTATSASPMTYQWRKGTSSLAGRTNSLLTFTAQVSDAATNYNVIVANSDGSVTSRLATLTVLVPPTITGQPTNVFLPAGSTAQFHVTATGSTPLSYQWQKEGVNLANLGRVSGATSPDLTITAIQGSDVGNYRVVVTNAVRGATSVVARLDLPVPPIITTNPATQVVGVGAPATFCVTATGSPPLSYQWYLNGSAIGGATDTCFSIPTTGAAWLGSYQVRVWNGAGTNWSATAGLWMDTLKMYAGVNVYGPAGSNCVVQYATNLTAPVTWTPLQSVTIVTNPTVVIDYDSPDQPKRYYRALPQ